MAFRIERRHRLVAAVRAALWQFRALASSRRRRFRSTLPAGPAPYGGLGGPAFRMGRDEMPQCAE